MPRLDANEDEEADSAPGLAGTAGAREPAEGPLDLVAIAVGKTKEGSELPANLHQTMA